MPVNPWWLPSYLLRITPDQAITKTGGMDARCLSTEMAGEFTGVMIGMCTSSEKAIIQMCVLIRSNMKQGDSY